MALPKKSKLYIQNMSYDIGGKTYQCKDIISDMRNKNSTFLGYEEFEMLEGFLKL
jgi:hypothetical protein